MTYNSKKNDTVIFKNKDCNYLSDGIIVLFSVIIIILCDIWFIWPCITWIHNTVHNMNNYWTDLNLVIKLKWILVKMLHLNLFQGFVRDLYLDEFIERIKEHCNVFCAGLKRHLRIRARVTHIQYNQLKVSQLIKRQLLTCSI